MKSIKHLVVMTPSFPKNEGNDIVVPPLHLYLRTLRANYPNVKIHVLAIHFPFHNNPYRCYDIDVIPIGVANGTLFKRPLQWFKIWQMIRRLHKEQSIDLLHSFWLNETAFIAHWMARFLNIIHLCTMMGQDALKSNKYHYFIPRKKMVLVCLSDFQKKIAQEQLHRSIHAVIPWGVSLNEFQNVSTSEERTIDLLCVSSLISLKNIHIFIDVVHALHKQNRKIRAQIIGGGPEYSKLLTKIEKLQLTSVITLSGKLLRQECLAFMRKAKILIHPSSYEAQGYVLNEALASGCYVLSLSQGLIIHSEKMKICTNTEDLMEQAKLWLNITNPDYSSQIPISMDDTLNLYEQVLQKFDLLLNTSL